MIRILTAAALLALAVNAAQAEGTLAARIHAAAVTACAPERADTETPSAHYRAIDAHCVWRLSNAAMAKYQTDAKIGTAAKLATN